MTIELCLLMALLILVFRDFTLNNANHSELIFNRDKEKIRVAEYVKTEPEKIIGTIEYIMDLEMKFSIDIPFTGKDIKRITDFEASLKELTDNTISALNPGFFKRAEEVGFTTDYLLEYITRGCTVRLLKYIQDNNAGFITNNDDEEVE